MGAAGAAELAIAVGRPLNGSNVGRTGDARMNEFRMMIANTYSLASGPAVTGRIEVGFVEEGDLLTLLGRGRQGAVRVTGIQRVGASLAHPMKETLAVEFLVHDDFAQTRRIR